MEVPFYREYCYETHRSKSLFHRHCIAFLALISFCWNNSVANIEFNDFLFLSSNTRIRNRHEVKGLKSTPVIAGAGGSSKERLTIDWFTQSIAEIRSELAELQEASSNTSRHLQQRNQCAEDIAELRDDFGKLKLEFGAMRMRQETIDQAIKDLQAETIQRDEDIRRSQSHVSIQLHFSYIYIQNG